LVKITSEGSSLMNIYKKSNNFSYFGRGTASLKPPRNAEKFIRNSLISILPKNPQKNCDNFCPNL
jgi:hypothetical protein